MALKVQADTGEYFESLAVIEALDYAVKHDAPLILGIGAGFLALASPPEVEERVKHYIEVGGKGGRLVLYLCNLGATTPPENVRAAIQAVHKYGTYSA